MRFFSPGGAIGLPCASSSTGPCGVSSTPGGDSSGPRRPHADSVSPSASTSAPAAARRKVERTELTVHPVVGDTYNRSTAASERHAPPARALAQMPYFLPSLFSHLPASRRTLADAV